MKKSTKHFIAISIIASTLFIGGCKSVSDDKVQSNDQDIVKEARSFKDYASDTQNWTTVETLFGPNPDIEAALSVAHGTGKLFRTIYKSPIDAELEAGVYPNGTIFVKELRMDNNGEPGELAGSTTVMIKESEEWTYIKLNPSLTEVQAMGTLANNEITTVAGCTGCHSQADGAHDYTFAPAIEMMDMNKTLDSFLGYENSPNWTLVDTTVGQDAAGTLFDDKHGMNKGLFRKTYKKQLFAKVDGEYPVGTMFIKELSMPDTMDATKAGEIMGPLTMMLKRSNGADESNNWEYFMTDANRTMIILQGQKYDLNASMQTNVSGCITCHSIAQIDDVNNDYIFKRGEKESETTPTTQIDAAAVVQRVGCSTIFCHGETLTGIGGNGYNLSAQTSGFIKDALTKFKNGERAGGAMPGIAASLSDEEIDALAEYIPTVQ